MNVKRFNKIGDFEEGDNKRFRKLKELKIDQQYSVDKFESIKTRFGVKIVIVLKEEKGLFFLPARFEKLDEEEKNDLLAMKNVSLIYKGEKTIGKYKNSTSIINLVDNGCDDNNTTTGEEEEENEEIASKILKLTKENNITAGPSTSN